MIKTSVQTLRIQCYIHLNSPFSLFPEYSTRFPITLKRKKKLMNDWGKTNEQKPKQAFAMEIVTLAWSREWNFILFLFF